jgi:hypothetical protein
MPVSDYRSLIIVLSVLRMHNSSNQQKAPGKPGASFMYCIGGIFKCDNAPLFPAAAAKKGTDLYREVAKVATYNIIVG